MPNPFKKISEAISGKAEASTKPAPASKSAEVPKSVTAYKEYRDKDSEYMKGQVRRLNQRLALKGMPKRSK